MKKTIEEIVEELKVFAVENILENKYNNEDFLVKVEYFKKELSKLQKPEVPDGLMTSWEFDNHLISIYQTDYSTQIEVEYYKRPNNETDFSVQKTK